MNPDVSLIAAFLVGLLGSTHCLGMCGGIVSALTFGLSEDLRRSPARLLPYLLTYNLGRITSYAVAGAIVGALGAGLFGLAPSTVARALARIVTGLFMIALGLYLAGWWPGLQRLEQWGGVAWARLEPVGRKLLPVSSPLKALGFGLVWGWLPCGMVYAALATALGAGGPLQGAAFMVAFGLGTLPMLLAVGGAAGWFRNAIRTPVVRTTAGLLIIAFGVYTLVSGGGRGAVHHHVAMNYTTVVSAV